MKIELDIDEVAKSEIDRLEKELTKAQNKIAVLERKLSEWKRELKLRGDALTSLQDLMEFVAETAYITEPIWDRVK